MKKQNIYVCYQNQMPENGEAVPCLLYRTCRRCSKRSRQVAYQVVQTRKEASNDKLSLISSRNYSNQHFDKITKNNRYLKTNQEEKSA